MWTQFHSLVCDLFQAVEGAVNYGIDCLSGQCGGSEYDGVEAKCHDRAIDASIVRDVHTKYGRHKNARLAIATGIHGFTNGAVQEAARKQTHLYLIVRTARSYAARRVAPV